MEERDDREEVTAPGEQPLRRDWIAKSVAGVLLGLGLAFGCSGVLAQTLGSLPLPMRAQLAMWIVPPIWLTVAGLVFLFRSGLRAWAWLGLANAVVFGAFLLLRHH